MPNMLTTGLTWLKDKRSEHMTSTVRYIRGAHSVNLAATIGRTLFETDDQHGVAMKLETRDYLIETEDLIINGAATLPMAGDKIWEVAADSMYEVMNTPGEPCWRYSGTSRGTLRVHTKSVHGIHSVLPLDATAETVTFDGTLATDAALDPTKWKIYIGSEEYTPVTVASTGTSVTFPTPELPLVTPVNATTDTIEFSGTLGAGAIDPTKWTIYRGTQVWNVTGATSTGNKVILTIELAV